MTSLEAKITALLVDCEPLLDVIEMYSEKWFLRNDNSSQLRSFRNDKFSLNYSYFKASSTIKQLNSYAEAKSIFERDDVFFDAHKKAGYYATFDAVIQHLVSYSGKIQRKRIKIDLPKALICFRSYRQSLQHRKLNIEASARLIGVDLRCKSLSLFEKVTLYRLSRKELNDRQPIFHPHISFATEEGDLTHNFTEIRAPITVPVDHSKESAFFDAKNNAQKVAKEIFTNILHAILLATSGAVSLSSITLSGEMDQLPIGRQIPRRTVYVGKRINIGKREMEKIAAAYDLVSGGRRRDETLSRALHRFIIGRHRSDLSDKLVDYVIACEAIFLTENGNPIDQELSYRFAINGASIMLAVNKSCDPQYTYRQMRSAYSLRSAIIHGVANRDQDRALSKGDFSNIGEVCNFLEENFRLLVFWLASRKPNDRPYRQHGGWEKLLWKKH